MALIVNGERIEDSAIKQEVERLRPDYEQVFKDQSKEEREAQLLDWSRENVLERVLIDQEARKNAPEISEQEVESAFAELKGRYEDIQQLYRDFHTTDEREVKEQIKLLMRVERRLEEVCKNLPEPSEAEIRQYYEENQEQFTYGEQARVAHIVRYVNWQSGEEVAYEAIKQAKEELDRGVPFEVVVDKYTDCADSGGDLGIVMRGQMVEEFEDVVFSLAAGQVSDIFRTRFGYHIAKVYDRKPPTVAKLEEVRAEILKALRERMQEQAINDFIDGLKSKARIEEVSEAGG